MTFLRSIQLSGFLSFPPDAAADPADTSERPYRTKWLGEVHLIEAVELLHAQLTAFAAAIRDGGGAQEWLWKGKKANNPATIEAIVQGASPIPDLRYRLVFATSGLRTEVIDETIEEPKKRSPSAEDVYFYYRFQKGRPVLNVRDVAGPKFRSLKREDLVPDESVLSQRKGSDVYPEVTWLGQQFERIQTFREWSFGRYATLRRPQSANSTTDALVPDCSNLGLLVNALHTLTPAQNTTGYWLDSSHVSSGSRSRFREAKCNSTYMNRASSHPCRQIACRTEPFDSWRSSDFCCRRHRRL